MSAVMKWSRGFVLAVLASLAVPALAQTTVRYVHTDALGSVVAMSDQGRVVVEHREYEPYGRQLTALENGPGYTGHVQDAATGLTYMQQRYLDPQLGVFLSVDPVDSYGSPVTQFHRYRYGNWNPYGFTDPDGRYGRGTGWSNTTWTRFDRAQRSAANSLERAAAKITKALETGKGLKGVTSRFERAFGEGSATPENMSKIAATMVEMAGALRDDGSGGFMANAMSGADLSAKYPGSMSPNSAAGVPSDNRQLMLVNLDHPAMTAGSDLSWIVGHESAHSVGIEGHPKVNGVTPYKLGSKPERKAFNSLPSTDPAGALRNPDSIVDFAK